MKSDILYHGSIIGGLDIILANAKSHSDGGKVAYFTTDRVYALVCCRSKEENFVTMGPGENGIQHYYERFPNQLKVMYDGKEGFLYSPISVYDLKNTKDHSWESPVDVPVVLREHIENVYEEILAEERAGNVIIHRYDEIDPVEQKMRAEKLREYVMNNPQLTYREFIIKHFSPLWD